MGIFTKGSNKGAYQGRLTCPTCHSIAIRKMGDVGPYMTRYRCRKCGFTFLYDTGPSAKLSGNLNRPEMNPYARLGEKLLRTYKVPIIGAGRTKKEGA